MNRLDQLHGGQGAADGAQLLGLDRILQLQGGGPHLPQQLNDRRCSLQVGHHHAAHEGRQGCHQGSGRLWRELVLGAMARADDEAQRIGAGVEGDRQVGLAADAAEFHPQRSGAGVGDGLVHLAAQVRRPQAGIGQQLPCRTLQRQSAGLKHVAAVGDLQGGLSVLLHQ